MILNIVSKTCRCLSTLPTQTVSTISSLSSLLEATATPNYTRTYSASGEVALKAALMYLQVHENFIDESEENSLLTELEPYLRRLRYEHSHWDDAIHGYRETEKSKWTESNNEILQRIRNIAFSCDGTKQLNHIHVLDINKEGFIKPHIDSVRFCGDTIAGLSLMSSSVMKLIHEDDKDKIVNVLLKRRSLYIMRGDIRYKYTHEILPNESSYFNGEHVQRDRRVSIMFRNEPKPEIT